MLNVLPSFTFVDATIIDKGAIQIRNTSATAEITSLTFDNVRDKALFDIWAKGEAFTAYRGTGWMPELCGSCDRKEKDWGGCRCQAFAWNGDAGTTDPACSKAPNHAEMRAAAEAEAEQATDEFEYRAM